MFRFWGDGSREAMELVEAIRVRSTENFNWTFIFILSVIFYIYWTEIRKKNKETVCAGLALYGVHWLYEICNAVIGKITGYPLWSVSNESTTFILLIGVCWELSMMFSIAGMFTKLFGIFSRIPSAKLSHRNLMSAFSSISASFLMRLSFCPLSTVLTLVADTSRRQS